MRFLLRRKDSSCRFINNSFNNNQIIRIMAKYEVRVRYAFEGTYKVVAEDRDEAERMVEEDCGLVLGGNIHTTR